VIIPAVGGLAGGLGNLAANIATGSPEALTSALGSAPAGAAEGLAQAPAAGGVEGSGGTPSFGSELTSAISSLEEGQQSAANASQALATGKATDPEAAVTTVEDAALQMQLAAQLRTKATEAAQTIFQTQV
jgi:flagellar hook-basal body complex protein FliE